MPIKKLPNEDDEAIRFENEFLKDKINAQYGGIHGSGDLETPPEILNTFLNDMIEFEHAMNDRNEVLLYDFIGRPEFILEQDLSDEQVKVELERVNDMLFSINIVYDNINDVEDRLLYKFVTEDLFQQQIPDKLIPGTVSHYIYEDFHPDQEYNSRMRCVEFIDVFFSSDFEIQVCDLFLEDIRNFDDLYDFHYTFEEFRNVKYEVLDAAIVPGECIRKATISFDAVSSVGTEPIHYSGDATFELEYKYDRWSVIAVQLPGMETSGNSHIH